MKKFYALMIVLAFALQAMPVVKSQTLGLDDGWQLQTTVLVNEDEKTVSSLAFKPDGWHPTQPGWSVLNALIKDGIYPDYRLGMNTKYQIPDISDSFNEQHDLARFSHLPDKQNPWTSPWWHRTTFFLESVNPENAFWLEFDCINYRAEIWLNGQMVADREQVVGMFLRYQFDVSNFVQQGENVLAVKIFPIDHPAHPDTQLIPLGKDRLFFSQTMLDMTMVMSHGYDNFPTIRDRLMGILQDVRIRQTGPVAMNHPFVKTEMRLPRTEQATVDVTAELVNAKDEPQDIIFRGRINGTDYAFEYPVTLQPGETRLARPWSLFMQNPKLWFPFGHGEQNLYTMSLEVVGADGTVFDTQDVRFGVRQIGTYMHQCPRGGIGLRILINGKKIFARGGFIHTDAMLEWCPERMRTELRYYKEAGLNFISFHDIPYPPSWFYDICDELGIMVANCYYLCHWMQYGTPYPLDVDLAERSSIDITKRFRNHPSLIKYDCVNESSIRREIYLPWRRAVIDHDGTRFWTPSLFYPCERYETAHEWIRQDMPTGMNDIGAIFHWVQPREYFRRVQDNVNWMFMCETGSPSLPPVESLRLFLPNIDSKQREEGDDLFPLDPVWAEHGANQYFTEYHRAIYRLFSPPRNVADYAWRAHILTADAHRAMFEAVQHKMWTYTSGFSQWKLNSAWPCVQWQIFDWYHRPMVSYYFIKKANRPVHVLWSPLDNQVYVVNHNMEIFQGTVQAEVFDFDMKKIFSVKQPVEIHAESSSDIGLKMNRYNNVPEGVYFTKLQLFDTEGSPVSDNFYWIPTQESLAGLEKLPPVSLEHTAVFREEGDETVGTVTITNPANRLAFFVRAILQKGADKKADEVLPVLWSDNYISLLPGESQTLEVRITTEHLAGQKPVVRLEGKNLKDK